MNDRLQHDPLDENLRRMLESAVEQPSPGFEARLTQDVLMEVARLRAQPRGHAWRRPWLVSAAAAAAALLIGALVWTGLATPSATVGRLSPIYGMVAILGKDSGGPVADAVDLRSGQRIEAHTGTKAEILLADRSKLTPDPRSRFQIVQTRTGPSIVLEQGAIRVQAAKQAAGRSISIAAGDSHIKVLGTDLEVRLASRPDGTQQASVYVHTGCVEMESAGQRLLVLPGTEGMAEKGRAPARLSLLFEVNEMIRLYERGVALAKDTGCRPGLPVIIDTTSSTLWAIVPFDRLVKAQAGRYALSLRYPAFRVQVFTLEGEAVPASGQGRVLTLNPADIRGDAQPQYLILRVPGVDGLITATGKGDRELQLPAADPNVTSLVQVHLPPGAHVDTVAPDSQETAVLFGRQIITVAAHCELPAVMD